MRSSLLLLVFLLVSLAGYSQSCTLTANPTATSTAICSGNSVIISANAASGTAPYAYSWSTGETTPTISVNKAGTYTVTVTDANAGCQAKGSVTITATATPPAPTVADITVCPGSTATLVATAPGGVYQWYDANGNFLFTGATYNTPVINSQTIFYVEATVGGCTGPRKVVNVFVYGAPGAASTTTCERTSVTLRASDGFSSYEWWDAQAGGNRVATSQSFTTPILTSTTNYYVSGVVNGCATGRTSVTVFVNQAPPAPTAADVAICSGSKANLHADAPAGNIDWFDVPTGGVSLITSPDFTTPVLTANKTYYVQVTTGCVSTRTAVTVTVNQIPPAPTPGPVPVVCPGTSARLTATSTSGVIEWFTRSSGGTAITGAGSVFDTPILTQATTYYVQANNSGCISPRIAVDVPLTSPPNAPTASPALICPGTSATLTATAPGGTYNWYTTATGGVSIFTGDTYITPVLNANTTYYVDVTAASGCISERTAVNVTLLPVTPAPTAPGATICAGNNATLTASGGNSYQWYDAATAGNKLFDGQVFVTPNLSANTTYYVQATSAGGCESTRTAVIVTVNPVPAAPTGNAPAPVCTNSQATLSVNPVSGITVSWFNVATGGTALATGNNFTTPPVTNTTTYYAEASNGSCKSGRTPFTVTLITGVNPQFQYPYNTVCAGPGSITPVINNPAGGNFSASPAGLVFVSTTTGEINIGASTPGSYTISFANNGACPGVTTTIFTIGGTTDATFSYNGPFCQGGINPLPVFPGAYSAGTFTATPTGLVFINASTGEIDLAGSAPGTYNITNTIAAGASCPMQTFTFSVTISQRVTVDAGPPQTVQTGAPVQLAGSISGGTTSGTWSGGAGTFSNASSLTAVYTPAAGENSVTLTLTSADPAGPCGPVSASVTIAISPPPGAPTASGATTCIGNTATLTATAPGGAYQWFGVANGGTSLWDGSSFITPALTATTTYYVSSTINGVTGARTPVTVTVNSPPSAPTAAQPAAICVGNIATLSISNANPAYTYEWYSAATGGNRLATGTSFTTSQLSANTSYYVQAVSNGCVSTRTQVDVIVNPLPTVTSTDAEGCSGLALNYLITSTISGATFTWSRAADPNISNPVVSNQTSSSITETLINTSTSPVNVAYTITAMANGCAGPTATIVITVYPAANVTSPLTIAPICNGTSTNYTITFNTQVSMSWARAAVPGISNAAVSDQAVNVIREVLFNTTNLPVNVDYIFTYTNGSCTKTFTLTVTVNPPVNVISASNVDACNDVPNAYTIRSNIAQATFRWSRGAVGNAPATSQTGSEINEALTNNGTNPIAVDYTIVPSAFGCDGAPFNYRVNVNPTPAKPLVNSNTPVCVASTILLNTPLVANAVYMWTGPNGYSSSDQNPQITAAVASTGRYFLTVVVSGCSSPQSFVDVVVNEPPTAKAGNDTTVCIGSANVQLAGQIGGGTSTGVWSSGGTGTFSPAANNLNAQYVFSAEDKAAGSVVLTLTSTSTDDCVIASSKKTITFGLNPAADAGPDQSVCVQAAGVPLAGRILAGSTVQWTTSGTGSFSPSANVANPVYMPGTADGQTGKVTLKMTVTNAGVCFFPADSVMINLIQPPTLNAGGIRYVLPGRTITLTPTVSDENVTYLWSPAIGLSDPTVKNPVLTGDSARIYTLTVTDSRGCVSTDRTTIKVSPELLINNTFTPNEDGINDVWNIAGLIAYENAVVDIYTRSGAQVFHSLGYNVPWNGTSNGKPLPVGIYYYVIDTREDNRKLTGWVTVIR